MTLSQEPFGSMSGFYCCYSPRCLEHSIPNSSLPIFNQSWEELKSTHSNLGTAAARTELENQIQTSFLIVRWPLWFSSLLMASGNCLSLSDCLWLFINCVFSLIKWPKDSKWKTGYEWAWNFIKSFHHVTIHAKVFKAFRNYEFLHKYRWFSNIFRYEDKQQDE